MEANSRDAIMFFFAFQWGKEKIRLHEERKDECDEEDLEKGTQIM
jgi:hypothetical protein